MKTKKIFSVLTALFAAVTMLTAQVSAYMSVSSSPDSNLDSSKEAWLYSEPASADSPFTGITKIQTVVSVEGDADLYFKDVANGTDSESGNPFSGFEGLIGIGAKVSGANIKNEWWVQFDFHGLKEAKGNNSGESEVKKLNKTTFLITADLTGINVDGSVGGPSIRIADWNSKSSKYSLAVKELFVYGPDGNVAIHTDGNGTAQSKTAFDASIYQEDDASVTTSAPETTEETTAETASEETEETTTTTSAETTTTTSAATTTAASASQTTAADTTVEETTAGAPAETTAAAPSSPSVNADLGSRDATLVIVGIAAGVVIIGVIVALVIVAIKKK